jgi:isoquinoline 1-oxidoreductase beta subunit
MSRALSRRGFIQVSAAATGGLLLGLSLPLKGAAQSAAGAPKLNAFVKIGTDDVITLIIHKPENGQGTVTSLAMLLAEELECDWKKIQWEFAPVEAVYGGALQGTFGSQAIRTTWQPLRQAGAVARELLISAAAQRWNVDRAQCKAENHAVINTSTGAKLSYGSLAETASKLPAPAPSSISLKPPSQFRLLGKATKRLDSPQKVTGRASYAIDLKLPGMLYAVVARSPVFGGGVAGFDAKKAKAVPGVRHVIQIPEGIAVVADDTWSAIEGRRALTIQWNEGANANLSSSGIRTLLAGLAEKPGAVGRRTGQGAAALETAARKLEAVYEVPYLAHAPMEPHTCVARVTPEICEVWAGTQIPGVAHSNAVTASGLPASKVQVHTLYMGGGFGSRGGGAWITEVVNIAKTVGAPVKLTYTREDDLQHDRYRPASYIRFAGGLDGGGNAVAWTARAVCSSWQASLPANGVDREGVAGVADILYAIPNIQVEYHEPGLSVPTNYWRSVGHSQNTFFTESFIDEMAVAAGKDPVEFRKNLLSTQSRLLRTVELAAEKAGWGKPLPAGRFQGIAAVNCFGSFNTQVAEVSIQQGRLRVHRVVSAVDCGQVVNPAGVEQQMQSAIVYGLSAALRGNITLEKGRVQQTNFNQYEPLRIDEMPVVETHIVASQDAPGGIGEVGTPAIAPAVTNAIFRATGKRIRRLPLSLETL